jgi:hypothetical protein
MSHRLEYEKKIPPATLETESYESNTHLARKEAVALWTKY